MASVVVHGEWYVRAADDERTQRVATKPDSLLGMNAEDTVAHKNYIFLIRDHGNLLMFEAKWTPQANYIRTYAAGSAAL